jgi:hypothetical protein
MVINDEDTILNRDMSTFTCKFVLRDFVIHYKIYNINILIYIRAKYHHTLAVT